MKERPILFSAAMVRAILEGRKTQTRRVVKPGPPPCQTGPGAMYPYRHGWRYSGVDYACERDLELCPYGVPGDRLWVRESFQPLFADGLKYRDTDWKTGKGYAPRYVATDGRTEWMDTDNKLTDRRKPGIHMPRWASRITLEITDVRVQRVQEIRAVDAIAEGIEPVVQMGAYQTFKNYGPLSSAHMLPVDSFHSLWDSINGKTHPWANNDWVWALTFKVRP